MSSRPSHSKPHAPPPFPEGSAERLQKVLAAAGYGSRRSCEELIVAGRVTVDGEVVDNLGVRVNPESQKVTVDGEKVKIQSKKYFLLNKPRGCLCTNSDPAGRTRVIDLLPPMETRLFSVGRLDENTEGLLLVTNDGELAHRLAHPRFQVERVYRVMVAGQPTQEVLNQLQEGVYFTEGKFRLRQAKKLKTRGQSTLLEIVITEGQNREVRRLFARIGHKVMSLQRIQFGPLRLGDMGPAEYRPLRPQEIDRIKELVYSSPPVAKPRRSLGKKPAGRQNLVKKFPPRSQPAGDDHPAASAGARAPAFGERRKFPAKRPRPFDASGDGRDAQKRERPNSGTPREFPARKMQRKGPKRRP